MDKDLQHKLKVFKLKDKIIREIAHNLLQAYPGYDYFDVSLTKEFYVVEELVSRLVDSMDSGKLEKDKYSTYCEYCNGQGQGSEN